jgi:hypothetical protein
LDTIENAKTITIHDPSHARLRIQKLLQAEGILRPKEEEETEGKARVQNQVLPGGSKCKNMRHGSN